MTPFVATIPIDSGAPVWGPIERRADVIVKRTGPRHFIVYARDVHGQRMRHRLVGYLVGIVNADHFAPSMPTVRSAIIACVGTNGAQSYLESLAAESPDYNHRTLEAAWQIAVVRNWLKDPLTGTGEYPWVAGEFPPDPGSTYGRPLLAHVPAGWSNDPFAPTTEEDP